MRLERRKFGSGYPTPYLRHRLGNPQRRDPCLLKTGEVVAREPPYLLVGRPQPPCQGGM